MAKTTIGEKAVKTGILLSALRDKRVAPLMRPYGLTNADIEEGWQLFMTATMRKISSLPTSSRAPGIDTELNAFEDEWFPVVRFALKRRFPAIEEQIFLNLERANGREVTWTTAIFVERLEAMTRGDAPYGEEGKAAREYLRVRGLTDEHVAHAKALLEQLRRLEADVPPPPASDEEVDGAQDAMWQWYLEWSGLARRAVKDGNLLRLLGFKKRKAGRDDAEEDDIEGNDAAAPARATGSAGAASPPSVPPASATAPVLKAADVVQLEAKPTGS